MIQRFRKLFSITAATLFTFAAAFAQSRIHPADSIAFVDADWSTTVLNKHAWSKTASMEMFGARQHISLLTYQARKHDSAILQMRDGKREPADQMARENGYSMIVNGSFFNVKTFYPATYTRIGKEKFGQVESKELFRVNGVIGFKDRKGRKPVILQCDTTGYETLCRKWHSVMAAGPVLMKDGERISYEETGSFFTKRHPRTLIGYDRDGYVTMVVIDGRFQEAAGTTIEETAIIAELLGLEDAINLDGGGSSTLWTEADGILNHPSDNKQFDHEGLRKIPNAIAVRAR